jgi:hypothetical protein
MAISADYNTIPESALVALAFLILKRTHLSLLVANREQAIAVIRGVKPAPPRKQPLSVKQVVPLCAVCHRPLPVGTLCDPHGRMHIACS